MTTEIRHSRMGAYNFCDPTEKTEEYRLCFDRTDRNNRTVEFTYREGEAPQLEDVQSMHPLELLDELEGWRSVRYLISTGNNGIATKPHEERIRLAREWAMANIRDDDRACATRLLARAEQLEARAQELRKKAVSYQTPELVGSGATAKEE